MKGVCENHIFEKKTNEGQYSDIVSKKNSIFFKFIV